MTKTNMEVNGFDLNGLPVTNRGSCVYRNVSYGLGAGRYGWNPEEGKDIYTACVSNILDEEKAASGYKGFVIHLSHHDNALDAAYVAMRFEEDKVNNLKKLRSVGVGNWQCEIPSFEYEALDSDNAVKVRNKMIIKAKSRTKVKTKAKIKVAGPKVKTQEELDRAAAMAAVFARKDALASARAKELVMERVTNYARNKTKNLDTSVQKIILAALAGQRVRDLISDFESGQRVVNVMVNNAKSKVAV